MLKQILKKIHIIHNIHIKHKFFIRKKSYSMEGEDLIISQYTKNIKNGFYVDAGCYHPLHLNNTYLLHKKNWNGINIDLSEFSISLFNYLRPNDVNINLNSFQKFEVRNLKMFNYKEAYQHIRDYHYSKRECLDISNYIINSFNFFSPTNNDIKQNRLSQRIEKK